MRNSVGWFRWRYVCSWCCNCCGSSSLDISVVFLWCNFCCVVIGEMSVG